MREGKKKIKRQGSETKGLSLREEAKEIFYAGLKSVEPRGAVERSIKRTGNRLEIKDKSYNLDDFKDIYVIGGGKAGVAMASAVEDILGDRITGGMVVVPYGGVNETRQVKVLKASHPIPDERGMEHAQEILTLLKGTGKDDLVLCLFSGGGSALLSAPVDGISLRDKQALTHLLLRSGAAIDEINTLRKHISSIKGGKMAKAAYPSTLISLILSDVIGDDLSTIASGPTYPDPTTFSDCLEILERYMVKNETPKDILAYLERGIAGMEKETVKKGDPAFEKTNNFIVGSNIQALFAAREKALALGYKTMVLSSFIGGETRDAAKVHAAILKEIISSGNPVERPSCIISGGETTVTVKGKGKGGRNQEFALASAIEINGMEDVVILSAGTDGIDGPTDAAGAIVDGNTVKKARDKGLNPGDYLVNNDSYNFFKSLGLLFITGPTGTNVMDMRVMLVN